MDSSETANRTVTREVTQSDMPEAHKDTQSTQNLSPDHKIQADMLVKEVDNSSISDKCPTKSKADIHHLHEDRGDTDHEQTDKSGEKSGSYSK
jgi:hypothetical protein